MQKNPPSVGGRGPCESFEFFWEAYQEFYSVTRLSISAWQLLQRLGQPYACLLFCREDGRFHFTIRDERYDLVRPSTIDVLDKSGLLKRERFTRPSYVITDKGRHMLRQRTSAVVSENDTCDDEQHNCAALEAKGL